MPFHGPELAVVLVVALLIFGPKRLPEMGSSIGKTIQAFKKSMNEIEKPETVAVSEVATVSEARGEEIPQLPAARETSFSQ